MALNKAALTAAIQKAFDDASANEWETPQVAAALATAIDNYVRGAAVTGVECTASIDQATSPANGHTHNVQATLTATQNVNGKLE